MESVRMELEKARTEARAKEASNRALKEKIVELFVEGESRLEEKRRLREELEETRRRLAASETSLSWYRKKLHESRASESIAERTRRAEIQVYRGILRERRAALAELSAKYERLDSEYRQLARDRRNSGNSSEMNLEERLRRSEEERNRLADRLEKSELRCEASRTHNQRLLHGLRSSERQRAELQASMLHLRSQLDSVLAHQRILTFKQEEHQENISEQDSQIRSTGDEWQESSEELSRSKSSEESIDEGYADGSVLSCPDLPVSPRYDCQIVKSALNVLSRSENLMAPLEESVRELGFRLQRLPRRCDEIGSSDRS